MTVHPASIILERPPARICPRISRSPFSGKQTMASELMGRPPIAYTSLSALTAAICPKMKGSSTMGVKKSTVCTKASSGEILYTPASSAVSKPTRTFGSYCLGNVPRIESSAAGLNLDAQPADFTDAVRRTGSTGFILRFYRRSVDFDQIETLGKPNRRPTPLLSDSPVRFHLVHKFTKRQNFAGTGFYPFS